MTRCGEAARGSRRVQQKTSGARATRQRALRGGWQSGRSAAFHKVRRFRAADRPCMDDEELDPGAAETPSTSRSPSSSTSSSGRRLSHNPAAVKMRQRFAKETEEQRLERLRINMERRRRKRAMETEEQRLERLQREREQRLASETRWRRLEKARETARRKRANETAEERAERLQHQRERRRQKMEEVGVAENSERLLAERARKRMFRVRETPEQRQRRLEKEREKRRLKRQNETEEERAERMRIDRERVRQKRAKETPEERSNRLQRERVRERARKFLNRLQMEERTGKSESGESVDTLRQFEEADKNFGALPKTLFGLVSPSKEFIYYGKPPFRDVNINNVYDKWRVTARFTGFEEQKLCRFIHFILPEIVLNPDDAYKITVRARARYNHLLGMPHEFKAVLKAFILHVCGDEDPSSDLSFVLDGILSYTPNERGKQVVHHNPLPTPKVERDESTMVHTPKLHLEESSITFVDPIEGTIEEVPARAEIAAEDVKPPPGLS